MLSIIIFILILSVLVLIHELGHFIMAKRAGIGVEEFGFGLPPRAWGKKIGGTIYSLNWLPFGGFVRLVGEDPTDKKANEKNSFYVKSIAQRTSVVVAGVVANFLLAIFIFYLVIFALGFKVIIPRLLDHNFKFTNQSLQVLALNASEKEDSRIINTGESILKVNDKSIGSVVDFEKGVKESLGKNVVLTLENSINNKTRVANAILDDSQVLVTSVEKDSVADKAGIKPGDQFVKVDETEVKLISDLQQTVRSSEGKSINVLLKNAESGQERSVEVIPAYSEQLKALALGVVLGEQFIFKSEPGTTQTIFLDEAYSLSYQTLPQKIFAGFAHGYNTLDYSIRVFGHLIAYSIREKDFAPVSEGVSGPVGIAQVTSQAVSLGLVSVLQLVALLSLNLGFINILPLPALDGGRFFFIVLEMITRRKVYPNVEKWVHTIGFAILLALTLLITYNDIAKLIR